MPLFVILDKVGRIIDPIFMDKPITFLKEVREELSKVAWPTREQTLRYTVLVLIVAIAVGLFLGGLDYILTALTAVIIQRFGG